MPVDSDRIKLLGAPAFRDLGGIPTLDGRHIRMGQIYRSEALFDLGNEDRERLSSMRLKFVCDLRSDVERSAHPCLQWLSPTPRVGNFDLSALLAPQTAASLARLKADPGPEAALETMMRTYQTLPRAAGGALREIFSALREGSTPVLIHCSAGKDRTGFVCAAVLAALGVSREQIMKDYLHMGPGGHAAHTARTALMMALILQKPLDPESLAIFSVIRPDYLNASFASLESEWGDFDSYIRDVAGLDPKGRTALQGALLET